MQYRKTAKDEALRQIINLATLYEQTLRNKKILFITKSHNGKFENIEVMFKKENFFHLTGLKLKNKNISPSLFYQACLNHKLSARDFEFKGKTTNLKLEIFPQIIKIELLANQIGRFSDSGNLLKTDILVGTTRNSCLGLKFVEKNQIYVPNTILKEDIRKITNKRNRVIAILKKDLRQKQYEKVTYIAQNTNIKMLNQNDEISAQIDLAKIIKVDKCNKHNIK